MNFDALVRDWRRYVDDVGKSNKVTQFHNRTRRTFPLQTSSLPKSDIGPLAPGGTFSLGQSIELSPGYRGTPEDAIGDLQKIIDNSLMIVDPVVVNNGRASNGGTWSFGYLMRQLANERVTGITPEEFTLRWLRLWEVDQYINGFTVVARPAVKERVIDIWPKTPSGELDLNKAPFRLLAIVCRLDLRDNLVSGAERIGGVGAGEARFIYCLLNKDDQPRQFTAIFEYEIKKNDFQGVLDWARQWYLLKDMQRGNEDYLKALEGITKQFASANSNPENRPNLSALGQLRTNDVELATPWDIREFRLGVDVDGYLKEVTVEQTPDEATINNTDRLADFINTHEDEILNGIYTTPVNFPPGEHFLGGQAITPGNFFWMKEREVGQSIRNGDARHLFSLGTCNGCHAGEAFPKAENGRGQFTHVKPRDADKPAQLSPFLTGNGAGGDLLLPDPDDQTENNGQVKKRPFNDLRRRAYDLHDLVSYESFYELFRLPLQFVH